jgi:LacI family transcriptional regulator
VSSFGRGILRGVTGYANLRRRWKLHPEPWQIDDRLGGLPHCDGAIVAGQRTPVLEWALRHVRHVILCSGAGDPAVTPVVSVDNEAVGALAAEHLLECRLERFAFFGGTGHRTTRDRLAGFRRALERRGRECVKSPAVLTDDPGYQLNKHRSQIVEWLAALPKPVGILAFDDAAALALAAACLEGNVGVPDRVAIIGVNDDAMLCETAWPPLSSVDCGWTRIGHEAAVLMDRLLAGQRLTDQQRHVRLPPVGVVQRQSTSLLAVGDPDLADAIRYIREHACDPCTVDDVLRHVPVGRRWLERQFAKTLGRTPRDEMVRVRVETAQRFLARTDMALPDIAARCGYVKSSHFHNAYKRVTGETPAAYRRKVRSSRAATPPA